MRKIRLACLASLLAVGVAHAASVPCNGFEVKIKNNTPDDLLVNKIELSGASLQPQGIQVLKTHTEQTFTVNNSERDVKMKGLLEFHSISLPSKKASLSFNLKNVAVICQHDDQGSSSDYSLDKTRLPGNVTYTIG